MDYDLQVWLKMSAYAGGGIAIGFGAIGAAIGEGHTAAEANLAISRNPAMSGEVFKNMLVGQAIAESASIFALVVALILLFVGFSNASALTAWALFSAGLCMGLGAIGSGIGGGFPAAAACTAMVRQPAMSSRLTTNMLVGSAVCQTPAIFSLVVSFILIYTNYQGKPTSPTWAAILGAGLATGLSAIGAGIGSGLVAESSCEGVARQPAAASQVTKSILRGQANTHTTASYGFQIAFIMLLNEYPASESLSAAMALLSAGICMGVGGIGPGLGEGFTAQSAVRWIARTSDGVGEITRTMLVGMAVAESTGIYSMVISLVLIFVL
jgi:F0F1-type ATP synthase membrane subunit c/vacuolar-type H+-ATPase subunit K